MLNDFLYVYKKAFSESKKVIHNTPWIITLPIIGSVIYLIILNIFFRGGIGFGRLTPYITRLIYSLILSQVFFQFDRAINRHSISPNTFQDGFVVYLLDIYIVRFILYIIRLLVQMISINQSMLLLISLIIFIIFNPIGETIYLRGFRSYSEVSYVIDFMKENYHIWLVHVLIFLAIKLFGFSQIALDPLEMYLFSYLIDLSLPNILLALVESFYLIFRGVMFSTLFRSSRRKRQFEGGF